MKFTTLKMKLIYNLQFLWKDIELKHTPQNMEMKLPIIVKICKSLFFRLILSGQLTIWIYFQRCCRIDLPNSKRSFYAPSLPVLLKSGLELAFNTRFSQLRICWAGTVVTLFPQYLKLYSFMSNKHVCPKKLGDLLPHLFLQFLKDSCFWIVHIWRPWASKKLLSWAINTLAHAEANN